MLAEMTAAEFDDWVRLYQLDPWGEHRGDLRMQRLAWAALQPHSKRKLREDAFGFKFRSAPRAMSYRQRAMQKYGMVAAAMERTERAR